MPRVESVLPRVHTAQMVGVGGCGGADVATLDVAEDVQSLLFGVFAGHAVGVDAGWSERLIHGDLRFDGRDDVGYCVDDGAVEFEEGDGQLGCRRFRRIPHLFGDFLGEAGHDLLRHQRFGGVESHDAWILLVFDDFDQTVHQSSLSMRLKASFEPMMVASGRPVTCHPPNGVLRAEEWNFSGSTVHSSPVFSTTRSTWSLSGTRPDQARAWCRRLPARRRRSRRVPP